MLNVLGGLFFAVLPFALMWGAMNLPDTWGTLAMLSLPLYAMFGLGLTVGYLEDRRTASD